MRNLKQYLAALLAALLLVTTLPVTALAANADGTQPLPGLADALETGTIETGALDDVLALIPLEERTLEVDLSTYTPAELRMIPLSTIFAGANLPADTVVAWSVGNDDNYTVSKLSDTVDIVDAYSHYNSNTGTLDCVVGSGKQLDAKNIHYTVTIKFGDLENWLTPVLYNGKQEPVEILSKNYNLNGVRLAGSTESYSYFNLDVSRNYREEDIYGTWSMGLTVNNAFRSDRYDNVEIYSGGHEDALANKAECLGSLIAQQKTYPLKDRTYTFVLRKSGKVVGWETVYLHTAPQNSYLGWDSLNNETETVVDTYEYDWDQNRNMEIHTAVLYKEFPASEKYYQKLTFYKNGMMDNSAVELAVPGYYATKEAAINAGAADIKADLFDGKGYYANYGGNGFIFSVFSEGEAYHINIRAVNGENSKNRLSGSTYLSINGADGLEYNQYYKVPDKHDNYSGSGFMTVLVLDENVNLSALKPNFSADEKSTVYAGTPAVAQESGKSVQDFSKGPVHYTVSAENGKDSGEYWVTFVQKAAGSKLFVNGVNGPDGAKRELFLNSYAGKTHDIFIANLGSEKLTGLKVTLNATNVKLDDYWTVGGNGNDTLEAFTTAEATQYDEYGELPNVAKIRILPNGNGAINGTLTITADGQKPVVITLSGVAGDPTITTTEIPTGVKYVPYGTMIQTTNMYDWNKLTFSQVDGKLPAGVTIKPNGEIYGVPQESGSFEFTVRMDNSYNGFASVTATYTLVVNENTDAYVDAATDAGYEIMTRVPVMTAYSDQVFEIKGELPEFIDFWLDGKKMEKDVDYEATEGSTKITIYNQTFQQAGTGSHTIAAEFRVNGDVNKDLKKAAQNYVMETNSGETKPSTTPGTAPGTGTGTTPGVEPVAGLKVGDIVNFTGTVHYYSSNSTRPVACRPGQARITQIYNGKHQYHLIAVTGKGSTVYGWVDASDIAEVQETPAAPVQQGSFAKGDKVTVKVGAKTYTGGGLADFVYKNTYTVIQVNGDRVVIGVNGVVTAAMNAKDLIPAN